MRITLILFFGLMIAGVSPLPVNFDQPRSELRKDLEKRLFKHARIQKADSIPDVKTKEDKKRDRKQTLRIFGIIASGIGILVAFASWQGGLILAMVGIILTAMGHDKSKPDGVLGGLFLSILAFVIALLMQGLQDWSPGSDLSF